MDEDGCKSLMLSLSLTGCFMVFHLADSVQQLANQIGRRKMKEPGHLYIKGLAAKTEFGTALHSELNLFWALKSALFQMKIYNIPNLTS